MIFDEFVAFLVRNRIPGAMRLCKFLAANRRLELATKHGVKLSLDPNDSGDLSVIVNRFYEEEVYLALAEILEPNDVFWDIGANLGLNALTVKRHFPDIKVYAFEPNPLTFKLLCESAQKNRLKIELNQVALSNQDAESELYIHPGLSGRCGLHNWDENPELKTETVTTAKGDSLIHHGTAKRPDIIKIDVEGHEKPVFEGLRNTLEGNSLRAIIFEDAPDDERGVKTFLKSFGFKIQSLRRIDSHNPSLVNYLATRNL